MHTIWNIISREQYRLLRLLGGLFTIVIFVSMSLAELNPPFKVDTVTVTKYSTPEKIEGESSEYVTTHIDSTLEFRIIGADKFW